MGLPCNVCSRPASRSTPPACSNPGTATAAGSRHRRFPGYLFVRIILQWHEARWAPGVVRLVMDGVAPAAVPDAIVVGLKSRETDGLIELPPRPPLFKRGDAVRIREGPFARHLAIFEGMKPHERVEVLLAFLGSSQRVTLAIPLLRFVEC